MRRGRARASDLDRLDGMAARVGRRIMPWRWPSSIPQCRPASSTY